MSTNTLIQDLQAQAQSSPLMELMELQKSDNSFVYVTPGENSGGSSLQLYDHDNNSTLRTYAPYPVAADGFDIKITGAISRPTCNFSNIGNNFTTLIGTSDIDSLLGKKFIRRLTLRKYLKGESSDTGSGVQSIEFVRQVWIISKVMSRDSSIVTFELSSPFDLQGVKIPARQIVANACPWEYTGASPDLAESSKCGGCSWHRHGTHSVGSATSVFQQVYTTIDDEYIVPSTSSFTDYTAASGSTNFSINSYVKTTSNAATLIDENGIYTPVTNVVRYWLVNTTGTKTALGTPDDSNAKFDAIRVYSTYNASTTYKVYSDDRLNEMVLSANFIWKTKQQSIGNTPGFTNYWRRGDECGKRLSSCNKRFGYTPINASSTDSRPQARTNSAKILPFGGFPGSKLFD